MALEEGEPKDLGARCLRAPAPGEQQLWPPQVAGSAQLEAKPRSPQGPAVRMVQVRMAQPHQTPQVTSLLGARALEVSFTF